MGVNKRKGRLFVISGPSGVGKGTITIEVLKQVPSLKKVVTYTTRAPRPGEVAGKDYHFVNLDEFERLKCQGEFLEWAEVYGNFYGSPRREVERLLSEGFDVVLVLDVQGALSVKAQYPDSVLVFLKPPSLEELRRRLEERGTEPPEVIERRMLKASWEMQQAGKFNHIVVNDEIDKAVDEIIHIICQPERRG
ncbi:MAG: guanylate kinase [Candidatus Fervidibacter sp.]|uniref:guanylate kinase n=1 Tax=Candidatus Fervidibacter sp. TaxID=3100871 RepID=UPI00404ADFB0